jgi:GntR family transcriptional regulator
MSTKVLNFQVTRAPEYVLDCLKLPQSIDTIRIERLRLAEGYPYCYILNYLPLSIGQKIQPDTLLVKPLLKIIEDDIGINLTKAVQIFEATIADSQVAPLLEVRVGYPLLKIERTTFDGEEKPIEFVSILYRADKYLFRIKLKREKTKNSNWNLVY